VSFRPPGPISLGVIRIDAQRVYSTALVPIVLPIGPAHGSVPVQVPPKKMLRGGPARAPCKETVRIKFLEPGNRTSVRQISRKCYIPTSVPTPIPTSHSVPTSYSYPYPLGTKWVRIPYPLLCRTYVRPYIYKEERKSSYIYICKIYIFYLIYLLLA
jgi:hypothetical protein